MPSSKPPPTPASAPDLVGPTSILSGPVTGPREARRRRDRPYGHAHFEIDLASEQSKATGGGVVVGRLRGILGEGSVQESRDLAQLATAALHAFSARGFRWVERWSASPGGRLPLERARSNEKAPYERLGDLIRTLDAGTWTSFAEGNEFEALLTDLAGNRVEVTLRRVHKRHQHPISLDVTGKWSKQALNELTGSLSTRLPVGQVTLTKFRYV
jgi:hypothetical protein